MIVLILFSVGMASFIKKYHFQHLGYMSSLDTMVALARVHHLAFKGFTVVDISGVHQVNINYCGCNPEHPLDVRIQLLRRQWFPATTSRPQTVFTFHCLNTFHESTLQGKGNLYDFYHMLIRKTDNANIAPSIVRRVCISIFCTT
jgi:hypothetical protein